MRTPEERSLHAQKTHDHDPHNNAHGPVPARRQTIADRLGSGEIDDDENDHSQAHRKHANAERSAARAADRRLGFPVRPRGPRQLQRRVRGLPPRGGTPPRTAAVVECGASALGDGRASASSALAAEQRATPDQIRLRSGRRDQGGHWIGRLRVRRLHRILAA